MIKNKQSNWHRIIGALGAIVLLCSTMTAFGAGGHMRVDMTPILVGKFGRHAETVEDMRVKVLGGYVRVTREWKEKSWQINRRWAGVEQYHLKSGVRSAGTFQGITRNGVDFGISVQLGTTPEGAKTTRWKSVDAKGEFFVGDVVYQDPPITLGGPVYIPPPTINNLRWQDIKGNWIEYEATPLSSATFESYRPIRFGNSSGVSVSLSYDADNRIAGVFDHLNKQVIWYEYDVDGDLSLIKDYSGRQVEYRYNVDKQLEEVTDVRGYIWKYSYNAQGFIESKTDPNNNTTLLEYAPNGALAKLTDAAGNVTKYDYEYDKTAKEFYKRVTTPGGKITETWYNSLGEFAREAVAGAQVKKIEKDGNTRIETGEDGNKTIRIVNSDELTTKTTWPDGSFTTTEYAPNTSFPLKEVNENGVITLYEYDAKWNLKKLTEAAGKPEQRVTTYTYDDYGNRLSTTIEADAVSAAVTTSATYDEYGNAKTRKDGVGNVTSYTHDAMGNVLTETKPGNRTWTYTYDNAGNLRTETDPLDHVTTLEYDKVGNKIKVTDAMNRVTQYQYDASDRPATITNALNLSSVLAYDVDGKITKIINSSGAAFMMQYDARGRLLKQNDAAGNVIARTYMTGGNGAGWISGVQYPTYSESYSYDSRGNLVEKVTHLSASKVSSESYGYDVVGNRIRNTDAKGRITQYDHDARGRLVQTTDLAGGVTKYSYDNRDNLLSVTNALDVVIRRYTYDGNNRKTSEIWPDGRKVQYRYDDIMNTITNVDAKGQVTRYQKSNTGQVEKIVYFTKETDAAPVKTVTYTRNNLGQLKTVTDGSITLTRAYTALNQQESEFVNYGGFSLGYQYGFDNAGRKTSLNRPDGKTVNYAYDKAGQLTSMTLPSAGTLIWNGYQWNKPISVTLPGGSAIQWTYDALMRPSVIVGKDAGGNSLLHYSYTYDEASNIIERMTEHGDYLYGYDELDRLTSATNPTLDDETYTYDAVGNRLTDSKAAGDWIYADDDSLTSRPGVTYQYDANGSLVEKDDNGTITRYVYDVTGRMTEVRDGSNNIIASYAYDPFGRRIKKTVNGATTYFLYSDEGLIAEADSAGNVTRQYGWKPDGIWGTDPVYLADGSETYYYENDHLGTPQKLVAGSGAVIWSAKYESFGQAHVDTTTINNPLRFPGQYYDEETSNYYNYFRTYNPVIARYTIADLIGLRGGINAYAYVHSNPFYWFDPFGLEASLTCQRCVNGDGSYNCTITENGQTVGTGTYNNGTNYPAEHPDDDPYGENGPLPPNETFDLINADSPKFGRRLPSPTNNGNPGEVKRPNGKTRTGLRIHGGTVSKGCVTTGEGDDGQREEDFLRDLVDRNQNDGGTTLYIFESNCG